MVARIIPVPSLAPKHLYFLLRLDTLGSCSNATTGDSVANEAVVIAAAIKGNESVVQTLILVPLDVQIPQLFGAVRVHRVCSIVDLVGEVGAGTS